MQPPTPKLVVTAKGRTHTFEQRFSIGRGDACQLQIIDEYVSRVHAEVVPENGVWCIRDGGSANGIYVNGEKVQGVVVDKRTSIRLGVAGPQLTLEPESPVRVASAAAAADRPGDETILAKVASRYFEPSESDVPAGDRTVMIRRAFGVVRKRQRRRYMVALATLSTVLIAVAAVAWFQYRKASRQAAMAQEIFYSMKAIDVDIANVEKAVADSGMPAAQEKVRGSRERRRTLENNYDRYLATLGIYDRRMPEEEKLILRVARVFGECELAMPDEFKKEVQTYIRAWQTTGRLRRAIERAKEKGYTAWITEELLKQNLPPHFFYLALQESDFDEYNSGPPTYKGIAKGMWQFIPETAVRYGLRVGPLAEFPRPDPADERHHWRKATTAAARYLKDIYSTDAQASGLLVMASYNWGEHRVVNLLRKMPANPRERNFWKVLLAYRDKLPPETYNYVLSIVSAAVIGENPRLFGFDFENPIGKIQL